MLATSTTIQPFAPRQPFSRGFQAFDRMPPRGEKPSTSRTGALLSAGAFLLSGLLLHQLPSRAKAGFSLLTPDWKVWTRVILGIAAVKKINEGLNLNPPPWAAALETVAVLHPLSLGLARKNIGHLLVIAPLVAGMVEGMSRLEKRLGPWLKENRDVPRTATRLVLSAAMMIAGFKLYPQIYKPLARKGLFGAAARQEALAGAGGATVAGMVTCARGCTPGGVICMSELGEISGGLGSWFKSPHHQEEQV